MTLIDELHALEWGDDVASTERLQGGTAAEVWLLTYGSGTRVVAKQMPGAPDDMLAIEAEGLQALYAVGTVRVPRVLGVNERILLLEALAPRPDTEQSWERFGRDLAELHLRTAQARFGWHRDGYLGQMPQRNAWTDDGHAFFAEKRLLRYLDEPGVRDILGPADVAALERLCSRLDEIVPVMPAVLTHGDLWSGNVVGTSDAQIAIVDPAVSFTWAEVDISMLHGCAALYGEPAQPLLNRFLDAYQEQNASPDGWRERLPVLFLRELVATLAHGRTPEIVIDQLRQTLAPYRPSPQGLGGTRPRLPKQGKVLD